VCTKSLPPTISTDKNTFYFLYHPIYVPIKKGQDVFSSLRNAKWKWSGWYKWTLQSTQLWSCTVCVQYTESTQQNLPRSVESTISPGSRPRLKIRFRSHAVQKLVLEFVCWYKRVQDGLQLVHNLVVFFHNIRFYRWHSAIVLRHKFICTYYMFLLELMCYCTNEQWYAYNLIAAYTQPSQNAHSTQQYTTMVMYCTQQYTAVHSGTRPLHDLWMQARVGTWIQVPTHRPRGVQILCIVRRYNPGYLYLVVGILPRCQYPFLWTYNCRHLQVLGSWYLPTHGPRGRGVPSTYGPARIQVPIYL